MLGAAVLSLGLAWSGASALSASAQTAPVAAPAAKAKAKPKAQAKAPVAIDELDPAQQVSDTVVDIAAWVIASGDNRELPFAIVDKDAAQVLVFGADGKLRGLAPALLGSAVGDESAPGVGDRELKDIPLHDRTTPAGRYFAAFGPAADGKTALWVDYVTAVSIHALTGTTPKKEKRKERLASPFPTDNRITHGCINVSPSFYSKVVQPVFKKKGGVFYVLPDEMPLQAAFPGFEPPNRFAFTSEGSNTASFTRPARKRAKGK